MSFVVCGQLVSENLCVSLPKKTTFDMTTYSHSLPPPALPRWEPLRWISHLHTNKIAYHLLFWILVFVLNAAYITYIEHDWRLTLFNFALRMPFILACCYLNLYWLLPRYFYQKKLGQYGLMVIALTLTMNALNLLVLQSCVDTPICPKSYESLSSFTPSNFVYKAFYLFSIVGLTSGIKLSKGFLLEKQKADAVEKEKLQTELSLLKSQIHPHFFFNTLNNLYALTIKKSDLAPDMLLKLSDLMSYSLYESENGQVSLDRELQHMRNYIELESIRIGNSQAVSFIVSGDTTNKMVPPLIFLPIVENCFKHATLKKGHEGISIRLTITPDSIVLATRNPFVANMQRPEKKGGLGLRNARRRLDLLYADTYLWEVHQTDGFYCTTLQIPLT